VWLTLLAVAIAAIRRLRVDSALAPAGHVEPDRGH